MNLFKKKQKEKTYLLLPCVHAPFHNKALFESLYQYLKETKVDGLVIMGDFMDVHSLSSHDEKKIGIKGIDLFWEYREAEKLLDTILSNLPSSCKEKHYLYGNHEDRWNRSMKDVDFVKKGIPSPEEALNLKKKGFKVYTDWKNDVVHLGGKLDVSHGEFCNVHTAKKTIDTYRKSMIYAHTHRFQIYIEGATGGFNIGSMADFNSVVMSYATRAMKNSWLNAFALVTIDENDYYHVQPILWYNDRFYVNGKKY